jgi:hypothetical protein
MSEDSISLDPATPEIAEHVAGVVWYAEQVGSLAELAEG